jgi:hypothetical protein
MSLVEPGSDIQSGSDDVPSNPKKKRNTYLLAGGGVVVAALVFLYAKSKNKSAASSTTSVGTNSTTPTLVLPSSNQDATASSDYAALSGQIGNLANQLSQQQASGTPTPTTPTPTTPTPTTPSTPTPTTPSTPTGSYVAIGNGAAMGFINQGQQLYQSGAEANAWDLAHGTPGGQTLTDPNAYYGLSGPAALALQASGSPVYAYNPNG